jgi:hypothetical protein
MVGVAVASGRSVAMGAVTIARVVEVGNGVEGDPQPAKTEAAPAPANPRRRLRRETRIG